MRNLFFIAILLFFSCKINQHNAKGQNNGRWIEKSDDGEIIAKGWYNNGVANRKWRYYADGKLQTKEHYLKNGISFIKKYYANGRKLASGYSRLRTIEKGIQWSYSGKWNFYDQRGKLNYIRYYKDGVEIKEVIVKR